ncbi:NAD-dependent succinate-semialdehyde dehydrogenase [Nesterenkonia sp. NBAIMH1]|uniref:NAD-dependent succinate-semialdehyde dehydrogenase n=1 Tax=Nesterenkonia sp. NBAIMH1 TaxID=2600320 RepID=UPI0011B68E05|nr:NAD-dependent succinate-semialdehyde dehydrogenase [Nesterenkonia sp. NBAIMH1]
MTSYQSKNPATGEILETYPAATDAEVEAAVAAAADAYRSWSSETIERRGEIVARIGQLFAERADELAEIATTEMGKPVAESKAEAEFSGEIFGYFAQEGPQLSADQEIKTFSGGRAVIQRLPIGPLLGIMPWNFPYYQVARFVAPNLMLGNTVLLKHAESCPRSALAIASILQDAGVPEGVYANLFVTHEQSSRIIADPRIQGVSLTGSERAGAAVGELAGRHLKKAVLELGGSDPYIILDAENVAEAAETAWAWRLENTGQACNSNKRMIVHEDIYEPFVHELVARVSALQPGDPMKGEPGTYTPLSSRAAGEQLAEQVQDAVSKGATLHTGGELLEEPGSYFAPAVLTGITPEMRAYHEELFGPVAVVYSVGDDAEAVRLANDSPYGLGGSVFSADEARASAVASQLEVGMANVNIPAAEGAELPFGGVKRSGYGRELGPLGMEEFVNKRLFYIAD